MSKSPILNNFLPHKQFAFTLAEVLITLAIVGIVAALTIPTLVTKIQKHIYYNQFMKARSVIENALRLHAADHDCPTEDPLCNRDYEDEVVSLSKYFKGAQLITTDNVADICKGYDKLPISWNYINVERDNVYNHTVCIEDLGFKQNYSGFITMDGLLLIMNADAGLGSEGLVDTNGPDVGPNIMGRDVFAIGLSPYYYELFCGNRWGFTKECLQRYISSGGSDYSGICYDDSGDGDMCGARLIEEGKMTY